MTIKIKRKTDPAKPPEKRHVALIKKYRRMFNNIQDIYYETDSDGIILELSPSIESRLGWKRKALLGCPMGDLFVDIYHWEEILEVIKRKMRLRDYEACLKTRTGLSVPCSMNIRIISPCDEPTKRLIGLIRDISERKNMERALLESKKKYELLSITDGLTDLFNSRHFYNQLSLEMDRSQRYRHALSLILLDVDDFKKYNDTYGHKEGDMVLIQLADVIRKCLRRNDTAYRYGGEEFVIILPETAKDQGILIAERIRKTFKNKIFQPHDGDAVQKTVSLGVAQYSEEDDPTSFIKRADKNMYRAKSLGKDQTCFIESE